MNGKVTISEVAKEAGVSIATVSRVLNGRHTGATELRDRVKTAARLLEYEPNAAARQLAGGRNGSSMSFVLRSFEPIAGYYGEILGGAEEEARRHGHNLYLSTAASNMAVLADGRIPSGLDGESVSGVITGPVSREFCASVRETGLPIVLVNGSSADPPCDCVLCDNFAASYRAVTWLLDLGHQRIACIACDYPDNLTVWERVAGYRQALEDGGIPADPALFVAVPTFQPFRGEEAMSCLAARGAAPTAVFGTGDEVAVGAIGWAKAAGIHVPGELSVIGVNDLDIAARCEPALTTIRILCREMGRAAVQRLLELMKGPPQAARRIDVLCEFVVRDSCAPPPQRPSPVLRGPHPTTRDGAPAPALAG